MSVKSLELLLWLRDAGLEMVPHTLYSKSKKGGYEDLKHVRLGKMTGLCWDQIGKAKGSELTQWLKDSNLRGKVLWASSKYQAYIEIGDTLLYIDGYGDGSMDSKTWTVTVYGSTLQLVSMASWLSTFPEAPKVQKKPQAHILTYKNSALVTTEVDLKLDPISDLTLLYGSDFIQFHDKVLSALETQRSGMVLLYGPPGGGKTTYIRHLIACLMDKKRVVIIPKALIEDLGKPSVAQFLLDLKETPSIFVIEDAEDMVASDARSKGVATGTILNLADGLLSDIVGIQIIATFNCPLSKVDPAILRSGRLIGKREFGPLSVRDARALAGSKGFDPLEIVKPTMLCDIVCNKVISSAPQEKQMGFG